MSPRTSGQKTKSIKFDPDIKDEREEQPEYCVRCGRDLPLSYFYKTSNSLFFDKKIPVCKDCVKAIYEKYVDKFTQAGLRKSAEKRAVERMCMGLDVYYDEQLLSDAMRQLVPGSGMDLANLYFLLSQKSFNVNMSYDDLFIANAVNGPSVNTGSGADKTDDASEVTEETMEFFGDGYSKREYLFLQKQYADWTSRNECSTKAQEELFKNLCFIQLELQKAHRNREDTRDLDRTFRDYLSAANLQPKQAATSSASQNYVMGTLLQTWEKTAPVPEPDEDLKDVDNMGLYTEVFYRGHMARMLNLKNAVSNLYSKFMERYTVTRPDRDSDGDAESDEAIFDRIFGDKELL